MGYYIDLNILNLEELAGRIAGKNINWDVECIKQEFYDTLKVRFGLLNSAGNIKKESILDDGNWTLIADDSTTMLDCVYGILNHEIRFKGYPIREIPLGFAIGNEDQQLEELSKNYCKWYQKEHNNQSPKATFIVLTKDMWGELKDTGICDKIEDNNNNLFNVDVGRFKQMYKIFRPPVGPLERILVSRHNDNKLYQIFKRTKEGALLNIEDDRRKELYGTHCKYIEDIINNLIDISNLTDHELFVLLCGVWWHDIADYMANKYIKHTHNLISAKMFQIFINGLNKSDHEDLLNISNKICSAHTDHISRKICMLYTGYIPKNRPQIHYPLDNFRMPPFIRCNQNPMSIEEERIVYILCNLRFAKLLETDVYFDWPQWLRDVLIRCWPREYNKILKDRGRFHKRTFKISHNDGDRIVLDPTCNRICNADASVHPTQCIQGTNGNCNMCRFLLLAHYRQIKKELGSKHLKSKFNSVELPKNAIPNKEKYEIMYDAFADSRNNKLDVIYRYCCVYFYEGDNAIDSDVARHIKPFNNDNDNETMHNILSNISGDYLLDIFNNKLELNGCTGLMIDDICHKSRRVGITRSGTDDSSLSIEFHPNNKDKVGETKSISDSNMLYRALFLSLKYWFNTHNDEKLDYLQEGLDKLKFDCQKNEKPFVHM